MSFSDYLIDISLVAVVLVQVRGRRITLHSLLLPIGIVTYVAVTYLRDIPTAGNDLVLVVGCAVLGTVLGGLAGAFTAVTADDRGIPVAKAGVIAAALWVLGTTGRLAFQVYATHGGGPAIGRFSVDHDVTSVAAWTSAIVLMALGEAVARTAIVGWRANTVRHRAVADVTRADPTVADRQVAGA